MEYINTMLFINRKVVKLGRTLRITSDLMLNNYRPYDTIIIENAHRFVNLPVFVRLCLQRHKRVYVLGDEKNQNIKNLFSV